MQDIQESQFLDRLYDAAVDPTRWPSVMESLADLLGGTGVWLSRMSVADGSGNGIVARIDPAMSKVYDRDYASLNPFSNEPDPEAYMAAWTPEILTDEAWLPKPDLERTPYFNDFMRQQDIHSAMIIRLEAHGTEVCALTVNRSFRQGRWQAEGLARAHRLHDHLRRAFRMTETLAMGGGFLATGMVEALDQSPHALFVLSATGRIRRINTRGEALLSQGLGLSMVAGRLEADRADHDRVLSALIAAAGTRDPDQRTAGDMMLGVSEARPAISISVTPVRSVQTAVFEDGPAVIVCVTEADASPLLGADDVRLTGRERDALTWVAAGKSDWEIAAILGLSQTTVRFHVDNARKKLGAVNRAQAVALLVSNSGRVQ